MIRLGLYNITSSRVLMKSFEDIFRFEVKGIQNLMDKYGFSTDYIFYGNYHKLHKIKT